jgi:hypothetical protein
MSQEKYIGMDVHQATISVAVMNHSGELHQPGGADLDSKTNVGSPRRCLRK